MREITWIDNSLIWWRYYCIIAPTEKEVLFEVTFHAGCMPYSTCSTEKNCFFLYIDVLFWSCFRFRHRRDDYIGGSWK